MDFSDNYEHLDSKLVYIMENIKTKEIDKLITDEFCGCECETKCTITDSSKCLCIQRSGAYYSFSDKSELSRYTIKVYNNNPIYECNNNCKCKEKFCGNRLVQFGPRSGLKIVNTINRGLGLITEENIDPCNFICEYAGEIITKKEASSRHKLYAETLKLENNYIFCINECFGDRNTKTFIDPTFYGNIGRYINHSCQPNCELIPIRINDAVPKLCIFAKEKICKNMEITFDYGQNLELNNQNNPKLCLCLSKKCRKYLPFHGTIS